MIEYSVLMQRMSLPLQAKIALSGQRIRDWYEHFNGNVYISFSGGKDSTVLLHLVRSMYPIVPAVFVDTGLEYPEIRDFVETIDNVTWLKPRMPFTEVIRHYGYPVVSKEQAQYIQQYRNAKSAKTKDTRWNGNKYGRGKISEKWKYLVDSDILISEQCCNVMKKTPIRRYEHDTGRFGYIGSMASESAKRVQDYLRFGCNAFNAKRPISRPLGFWTENDIWKYIEENDVQYSDIYKKGYTRTGCMFCMFGVHLENEPNRFQLMQKTHPKQYEYCINKLGCGHVMDLLNVKYRRAEPRGEEPR